MKNFLKKKYKKVISLFHRHLIIFCSIFLLYVFTSINFKQKNKLKEIFGTQRKLFSGFEKQKTEDICQKADNDLILLYNSDSYLYVNDNNELKKSTTYLLNYAENKNFIDLKNYILSFYAQIILAIIDIFLVVIWVLICIFISRDKENYMKCLLNIRCAKNCLKNIFSFSSMSMYFIIIVINVIILINIPFFLQDINNSFCSLFKISYHTFNGEEKFYDIRPKWTGINQIKNLIQKTKENISKLTNQNHQINQKIKEIKKRKYFNPDNNNFIESYINEFCNLKEFKIPNPNPFNNDEISEFLYCSDILYLVEKEYNETFNNNIIELVDIYNILVSIDNNMNEIKFSFDNAKNKLDSFVKIITDMEVEYFNDLVYIFENIIRKYLIYTIYVLFTLVLLLEIVGFINLIILRSCYSLHCNKVYNFIWNFQFFSVVIIFLFAVFCSSLKIFISDVSLIIKSFYDNNKVKENRTFSNTKYDMNGLNKCIIGNGDLANYMNLDKDTEQISHFYSTINIIKNNLNFFKNYEIISEKNETNAILNELENKTFLAKFKLLDDNNYVNAEEIIEKYMNIYTDNESNQNLKDNDYYSNYYFVFDKEFCKSNYTLLSNNNEINDFYKKGNNCMILKDFPSNNNYFKTLTIKNNEQELGLNDLVNEFKKRYYNNEGFETSFLKLLQNSRNYLETYISKESNKIKNDIIKLYEALDNKINLIHDLYKNILEQNSTDLYSAFNCRYLKRDFFIFLDQLDDNLTPTLKNLTIYCFILSSFSFFSILFGVLYLKINDIERKFNEELFKSEEKSGKKEITEKPKMRSIHENLNLDEGPKSTTNEQSGLKKGKKYKHVIEIFFEKDQ